MVVPTTNCFRSRPGTVPPERFGRIAPKSWEMNGVEGNNSEKNNDVEEEELSPGKGSAASEQRVVHSKRSEDET